MDSTTDSETGEIVLGSPATSPHPYALQHPSKWPRELVLKTADGVRLFSALSIRNAKAELVKREQETPCSSQNGRSQRSKPIILQGTCSEYPGEDDLVPFKIYGALHLGTRGTFVWR